MPKRRRLKRELVIAKAMEMADEAGSVTAVTLTNLAAALDIRTPSLYNHIAGLDDLQQGIAVAGMQMLLQAVQQASAGVSGRAALLAAADAYRHFAHKHPGIYPLTIRAPQPQDSELTALSQASVQLLLLMLGSMGVHGEEAIHAIRGLRALLHGFVSLEVAGGYEMPLDRDESFQRLVATFLDGLEGSS